MINIFTENFFYLESKIILNNQGWYCEREAYISFVYFNSSQFDYFISNKFIEFKPRIYHFGNVNTISLDSGVYKFLDIRIKNSFVKKIASFSLGKFIYNYAESGRRIKSSNIPLKYKF